MREAMSDVDSLYPKGVGPGSKLWIDGNGLGCVALFGRSSYVCGFPLQGYETRIDLSASRG